VFSVMNVIMKFVQYNLDYDEFHLKKICVLQRSYYYIV